MIYQRKHKFTVQGIRNIRKKTCMSDVEYELCLRNKDVCKYLVFIKLQNWKCHVRWHSWKYLDLRHLKSAKKWWGLKLDTWGSEYYFCGSLSLSASFVYCFGSQKTVQNTFVSATFLDSFCIVFAFISVRVKIWHSV